MKHPAAHITLMLHISILTALSLTQASTAPCGQVSAEPLVPPVGREKIGGQPAHPSIVQHFAVAPTLQHGRYRESVRLNHWESDCDGGRGLQKPTHRSWKTAFIFANMIVYLLYSNPNQQLCSYEGPNSNPTQQLCSSVEPSWGCILTMEHGGVKICLIWILKEEFC